MFVVKAAVDTDIAWEPTETCESVKLPEEIWEFLKILEDAISIEGLFFRIVESGPGIDAVCGFSDWELLVIWVWMGLLRDTGVV